MKFLSPVVDDDDPALLGELLKAVDEWNESSDDSSGCASVTGPAASMARGADAADCARQLKTHNSRGLTGTKRNRDPAVDVRRRLKKKQERISLRQQVVELQERLARLLLTRPCDELRGCVDTLTSAVSEECEQLVEYKQARDDDEVASAEKNGLIASKAVNEDLKTQVAKNVIMIQAMKDVVAAMEDKYSFLCRLTTVRGMDPGIVTKMYMDMHQIEGKFPEIAPNSMLCTSNILADPHGCPRVEMITGAHVSCDMSAMADMLATHFAKYCPFGRSLQYCIKAKESVVEQGYVMDCPHRNSTSFLSTGIVQKHESSDSLVLVWSSKIFHPSGLLSFVGRGWVIVTPSPHSRPGLPMTLVRSFFDLSTSPPLESAVTETDTSIRSFLLGAMGERARYKHKLFLRAMLAGTGRGDLAAAVLAC